MMIIHYDPIDGRIVKFSERSQPYEYKNCPWAVLPATRMRPQFSPERQYKVDLASVFHDEYLACTFCELIEIPPPPPTKEEVRLLRNAELQNTDRIMLFPPDRPPMSEEKKQEWVAYREALRKLGDMPDGVSMIRAWPKKPNGVDPIAILRGTYNG